MPAMVPLPPMGQQLAGGTAGSWALAVDKDHYDGGRSSIIKLRLWSCLGHCRAVGVTPEGSVPMARPPPLRSMEAKTGQVVSAGRPGEDEEGREVDRVVLTLSPRITLPPPPASSQALGRSLVPCWFLSDGGSPNCIHLFLFPVCSPL